MGQERKHKYLPVLITVLVMLFVAAGIGGGIWWYMDGKAKKAAHDNARDVQRLQGQINELSKSSTTAAAPSSASNGSSTADWKTFVNSVYKYSVKYPSTWQVKEYGSGIRAEADPTCIAKTAAEFPPPQTDAPCPINISLQTATDNYASTGTTRQTVSIAGKNVTKVTIPANSPDRFGGWATTEYIFPYNNSYLFFVNNGNYEIATFEKIVNSISFY